MSDIFGRFWAQSRRDFVLSALDFSPVHRRTTNPLQPELSPKNRSKKALSFANTRCFFSLCPPSWEKRDVGGSILVIAVPTRTGLKSSAHKTKSLRD
jgi:hypothetical protein